MLVGIDLGTSGAKAILMRRDGEILATRQEEYGIATPYPGWAEQRPETWLEKAAACVASVVAGHAGEIEGMAFSGQMHSFAMVGKDGKPVRDAIIWADSRSGAEVEEIPAKVGEQRLLDITLNRVAAGYGLASLVWLEKHEPEALERTVHLFCPKDYVRFRLGGLALQEVSDASATCCLDVARRQWAWEIIDGLGLPRRMFPPLACSTDPAGALSAEGAALCGLPVGTPLFFGGADNGLAGIGSGLVDEGRIAVNIGTGGQVGTVVERPVFDAEYRTSTFCHPIPGKWNIYGATLAAGLALKWFRDSFHPGKPFAALSELAAQAEPGCKGLLFLPYLVGERTPWLDPHARGIFFGLSLEHGPAELCRAVMEGVTFALEQSYQLLRGAGIRAESLLSMGGGAKSAIWPQIQADIFGLPVHTVLRGDACVGAAILAGVGCGVYGSIGEGCAAAVHDSGSTFEPDPRVHAAYGEGREKFKRLYQANRDLFRF